MPNTLFHQRQRPTHLTAAGEGTRSRKGRYRPTGQSGRPTTRQPKLLHPGLSWAREPSKFIPGLPCLFPFFLDGPSPGPQWSASRSLIKIPRRVDVREDPLIMLLKHAKRVGDDTLIKLLKFDEVRIVPSLIF